MTTRQGTPDILGAVLSGDTASTKLRVDQIRADGGTQMRAGLHDGIVAEYAEAMLEAGWGDFPPVVVFYDGAVYWLADGFHRLAAYRAAVPASDTYIPADVRAGTRRDAVLHAAKANAAHGLRRTNADKRRAVTVLLEDEEWARWSDSEIARQCAVSDRFVASLRKELSPNGSEIPTARTVTRNGQTYQQDTTNIGKPRTVSPAPAASTAVRTYAVDGPALPAWVKEDTVTTWQHLAPVLPETAQPATGWSLALDDRTDPAELGLALRGCVGSDWMEKLRNGFMGEA